MAKIISVPKEITVAREALAKAEAKIDKVDYEEIIQIDRWAQAMKSYWRDVEDLRRGAEIVIALVAGRIGAQLLAAPKAKGARGGGKKDSPRGILRVPRDTTPTLAELAGTKNRGLRLKALARYFTDAERGWNKDAKQAIRQACEDLWAVSGEATVTGLIQFLKNQRAVLRRQKRKALPLIDGMELRIGDCRVMLADVRDNSVPLILTDPPYGDEAEPLYEWLAMFAERVLIPGGSLICYTGHSRLDRDMAIFGAKPCLRWWWLLAMMHHQSQRLPGKFVIVNFKPVLWYVKEFRRGRSLVPDKLVPPKRDKDDHKWGQGEGGIQPLIEHLTEPNELIVDPFAGTAQWGRIAAHAGRRWLGCDIVSGGAETVEVA